ncbi:DNA-binding transcriptional regulator AsnC, partial [Salmonella enterica subsp. enterica serovar Enteritidis str. 13183-1]
MENARTAYAELAKQFGVSPGTIHVRVEKMKQAGITGHTRIKSHADNVEIVARIG